VARYKTIELDDALAGVIRHMNAVEEYREVLQSLQAVWDNLTLLGQLSGAGTDMSSTRQAFNQLTSSLLNQLGSENLKKAVLEMKAKAQVAIDILVRNLFERTADIGFLATDNDIRRFVTAVAEKSGNIHYGKELEDGREALKQRFAEYVAKYSVYSDIVLLDTTGKVLARLDDSVTVERSSDALVKEALETSDAYVETCRVHDLLPGKTTLVYSYRVCDAADQAIGVLCLCFRFENEMEGIFANLAADEDWAVITLIDADGKVIASSDSFHIPIGAPLEPVLDADYRIVRFAGREYLATTRPSQGYQGYQGPGWFGHVMMPVQHAFNKDASAMLRGVAPEVLGAVMTSPSLFGDDLRGIPAQAERIQADLNRSVWNGNVRLGSARQSMNPTFSKILLWEISNTGAKTKDVFERSIANLHETVVSAILQDSRFLASLAIDIMDRNLYERANDCRWWALTSAFRSRLSRPELSDQDRQELAGILSYINGLYTVYSNLILFDLQGRVVAVSRPEEGVAVGSSLGEEWVRRALSQPDSQGYAVSSFAATPLYGNRYTYIYGAPVHGPACNNAVGGVAIVFDGAPQFSAMLKDSLPRNEAGETLPGAFALFAERDGSIVACSGDQFQPGQRLPLEDSFGRLKSGESHAGVVRHGDSYYAVGGRMSSGYREYKGKSDAYRNDVLALVFLPLCEAVSKRQAPQIQKLLVHSDRNQDGGSVEVATFHIGTTWFGLRSENVVEAVDPVGITGVPGAGDYFGGYLMYNGMPIPVYDIAEPANAGPHMESSSRQVIVLRKGDGPQFGILVDGLGEIPEIAATRLQPLPPMLAGGNVLGEAIITPDNVDKDHLLLVLGVDRIAARLGVSVQEAPGATISFTARRDNSSGASSAAITG